MALHLHLVADRERAKALLVSLVLACPEEQAILRTQLYKGYYFALLMCMSELGAELVNWPVVKMPQGPGVECGEELLEELCAEGALKVSNEHVGPFEGFGYHIGDRDLAERYAEHYSEPEAKAIRDACEFARAHTGSDLSRITHQISRSWNAVALGHTLPVYADLILDDEPSAEMRDRLRDVDRHLGDTF